MNILHVRLIELLTSLCFNLAISIILGFLRLSLHIRTKQPCKQTGISGFTLGTMVWLAKCCKIQQLIIFIQQKYLFNFNKNIYSTSTKIFIQLQQKYLFNFNKIIYSTSTKNIYSTSTKNNFIQQQSSRTFKISSFNKIPRPSPVKYKTALSHASNISKACQIHN